MVDAMRRAARHAALIGVAGALSALPLGIVSAQAGGGAVLQLAQAGPGGRGAPAAQSGGSDVDRQVADLKKQLKITPQQEPQFNAFAEVMRNNAQELDALMQQASSGQPNAVEQVKRFAQFSETQANGMKRLVPALQALYDSLSDPQKKVADRVLGGGEEAGGAPGGPPPGGRKR
jgi:periplasmic protein CpxP/Spy